jgi:hypothetical protein
MYLTVRSSLLSSPRTRRSYHMSGRSIACSFASSLHRSSKPTMLYDVVRPSSIVAGAGLLTCAPNRRWRWSPVRCGCHRQLSAAHRPRDERARACSRPMPTTDRCLLSLHVPLPRAGGTPGGGHGAAGRDVRLGRGTADATNRCRHAPSAQTMDGCTAHASRARPSVRQVGACTAYNGCNGYNAYNAGPLDALRAADRAALATALVELLELRDRRPAAT